MLRVTIELVPHGDESKKSTLGTMRIANDGTGNKEIGNYTVRLTSPDSSQDFQVKGWHRKYDIWKFLYFVTGVSLNERFPDRRRPPAEAIRHGQELARELNLQSK